MVLHRTTIQRREHLTNYCKEVNPASTWKSTTRHAIARWKPQIKLGQFTYESARFALEFRGAGHQDDRGADHQDDRGPGRQDDHRDDRGADHQDDRGPGRQDDHRDDRGPGRQDDHKDDRGPGRQDDHRDDRGADQQDDHRDDPGTGHGAGLWPDPRNGGPDPVGVAASGVVRTDVSSRRKGAKIWRARPHRQRCSSIQAQAPAAGAWQGKGGAVPDEPSLHEGSVFQDVHRSCRRVLSLSLTMASVLSFLSHGRIDPRS
ncbi:eukaryotic translation initiation factor 3 subunit A-like [Selaginella moellendorffii]|uniref:eukaryotic translation initiation factor 3 subunit A-like n=1 Tax=Selaginella moellendorffii TaxID=88036 RepID=UPI000D1CEFDB|nr:eukaryotic translation initiation factor 3 subunit A-like [Selaginella moellendorffii]|eukprot:XP_024527527.1 eukaryotic translation initiation factor 3 subunit A-like [Selaginella moellendorffii]